MKQCILRFLLFALLLAVKTSLYATIEIDGIYYNIIEHAASVTSGEKKYEGAIVIPTEIVYNGTTYTVKTIGKSAFEYCKITFISIPNTVNTIERSAFSGCSLSSISIPNSVTIIESWAFNYCSQLSSIVLPNGITEIKEGTFNNCENLTTLTLPEYVTTIGNRAFYGCSNLTKINIPNHVSEIGLLAFWGCKKLEKITIPNSVEKIGESAFAYCKSLTSLDTGDGVYELGSRVFSNCDNLHTLRLGDNISEISRDYIYDSKNLHVLVLGKSMKSIDLGLFLELIITQIDISSPVPPSIVRKNCSADFMQDYIVDIHPLKENLLSYVRADEWQMFTRIYSIEDNDTLVAIPFDNPTSNINVSQSRFANEYGAVVNLNSNVQVSRLINNSFVMFRGRDLSSELNAGLSFKPSLFYHDNIISEYMLNSTNAHIVNNETAGSLIDIIGVDNVNKVTSLVVTGNINGTDLLAIRKMENLKVLDLQQANIVEGGMTYYGDYKTRKNVVSSFFINNTIEAIRLPNSAVEISDDAFAECSNLKVVGMGEKIEFIGNGAFYNCKKLIAIDFGENEICIGAGAFWGCTSITSLTLPKKMSFYPATTGAFRGLDNLKSLYINIVKSDILGQHLHTYPKLELLYSNLENYRAEGGGRNLRQVIFGDSVVYISSGFRGAKHLKNISLGKNVKYIGEAFADCNGLESVFIPGNVKSLNGTFTGCVNLKKVILEEGVEELSATFRKCSNLDNIILPKSIKTITNAFENCTNLTSIVIPDSVKEIGTSTFENCSNLASVHLPDNLTIIKGFAFYNCTNLTSISLPKSVTNIYNTVFDGCNNLNEIYSLNPTPPEIWSTTFSKTTYNKATLYVPKGSKTLYWLHPYWENFKNIVELDDTSINDVSVDQNQQSEGIYTINGVRQSSNADNLPKGIYIKNGKKVIIK